MLPNHYCVTRDECGDPEIRTRTGCVYEYSPSLLTVQVDGHPKVAARVKRLGYRVLQEGDFEITFLVPHGGLDDIASLIHPRRKRQLSANAKAALVSRLRRPQQTTSST